MVNSLTRSSLAGRGESEIPLCGTAVKRKSRCIGELKLEYSIENI